MKSGPIIIALFAAGLAVQSSAAVAKQCKAINVAATGFAESKSVAKTLAWEAWEAGVARRVDDESFYNSDNVGSPSEECGPNKSGKYSGGGSSLGYPGSTWVCEVGGTPCNEK